ncbi:MAG: YeeE/YedE thiosulfate transporter family protein [Gammaproteobacteria bacterium]
MHAVTGSDAIMALAGGVLIGLASLLLLCLNGRIAGISGIAAGLLGGNRREMAWRALFLLGLVIGAAGYVALTGDAPAVRTGFPRTTLVLAGLLVGYGTALGNGCTSGHGVCGLGRLSRRSLVATTVFVVVAIATTTLVRHVAEWSS